MIVQINCEAQSRLLTILLDMLESEELCNFTIKTGNRFIKAHKCVLAATLEYFRTSFRFSESCSSETSIDLDLSHLNCETSVIQHVIRSLYSNDIDLDQYNIEGILHLADYLLHKDLTVCVERFMENTLALSNVIFYFKLCIQYNLNSTSLFGNVKRLLRGRFHDFLIYEPDSKNLQMDVYVALHSYGLLDNCTPLQLMIFFFEKFNRVLLSSNRKQEGDLISIVSFLETIFPCSNPLKKCWNPYLRDYLNEWLEINSRHLIEFDPLLRTLKCLLKEFINRHDGDSKICAGDAGSVQENDNNLSPSETAAGRDQNTYIRSDSSVPESIPKSFSPQSGGSSSSLETLTSSVQVLETDKEEPLLEELPTPLLTDKSQPEISTISPDSLDINSDKLCNILVALAPSSEMASQLMEVEVGKVRPLLRAPKLCLHFYDRELCMWKESIPLDFPISGYMLEKHSWRMAIANGNLYMFSLGKKLGLEYCLTTSEWTHLSCKELFIAHTNSNNEEFPVKSIIPMSVGGQVVVLSMSREPHPDGSYWTQQHIYQFDPETKTFMHVSFVRDKRMDLPISKWTVKDDQLYMIKASAVMYRDLHLYNVQHIHVYNVKTRQMKTHHIHSAIKSGLKILVSKDKLFMINNLGEYQQFDLSTHELSEWHHISNPAFATVSSSVTDRCDVIYPALLRATCPGGSSRLTVTAQDNIGSASLHEMIVTEQGEFITRHHPNPPFLYVTAVCVGEINRDILQSMKQARFDSSSMTHSSS